MSEIIFLEIKSLKIKQIKTPFNTDRIQFFNFWKIKNNFDVSNRFWRVIIAIIMKIKEMDKNAVHKLNTVLNIYKHVWLESEETKYGFVFNIFIKMIV